MGNFFINLKVAGAISTATTLPFWMTANQNGLMPEYSGLMSRLNAGIRYNPEKQLQWRCGTTFAANTDGTANFNVMAEELYMGLKWKLFSLDIGMKQFDLDFYGSGKNALGSMSVTGGNVIWSGNARSMPGYTINLDPLAIPFTKQRVWIYGAYGDYQTLDCRYVERALVHKTQFYFLFNITKRLDFRIGLDHYAFWSGSSPDGWAIPATFANYLRIVSGLNGVGDASASDKHNVLGDHRGSELLRFDYRGEGWKLVLQHDIPYEDGSGMGLQNFPDGVNTVAFLLDDESRWLSSIVYEYHYTMYQSGTYHSRPTTEEEQSRMDPDDENYYIYTVGGLDNYFNNDGYKSGWTYYGRTIGNPLMSPYGTHSGTWTSGSITLGVENNRLKAHHLSISGKLFKTSPYKLMLTYSRNYGTYRTPYTGESQYKKDWGTVKETPLRQFSAGIMGEIPVKTIFMTYGLYADYGQLLPNSFGILLGLRYCFEY